jgi:mRNA interferase RelE/StbE
MTYKVEFSSQAFKFLTKADPAANKLIRSWVRKNLESTDNPRMHGRALKGVLKDLWRYRVGDYRLLAQIKDDKLVIFIVRIGNRSKVYGN